ncbi:hypothetical protein ACO1O0_000572 [Amphichorda felina]
MAGLVGYASSDEDDEVETPQTLQPNPEQPPESEASTAVDKKGYRGEQKASQAPQPQDEKPVVGPLPQRAVPVGPSLPPPEDSHAAATPTTIDTSQIPGSPYTANRALIHDLTLPSVPNLDIPPSPPGSPPPGTSKKFEQFLELKKKGVHFNAKLENSTSLRNPGLMDKLMAFVGIDERSQYETTLPTDLWDPKSIPDSAFRASLRKSREKIEKEREAERAGGGRSAADFVPATTPAGASTSTAGGPSRGEKRKGGWN